MDESTSLEVIIGGRKYTLQGVESEEYIQQLAWYLDKKIAEAKRHKPMTGIIDVNSLYIIINIVDDLFKQRTVAEHAVEKSYNMSEELNEYKARVQKLTEQLKTESARITQHYKNEINRLTEEYNAKISALQTENINLKERLSGALINQGVQPKPGRGGKHL